MDHRRKSVLKFNTDADFSSKNEKWKLLYIVLVYMQHLVVESPSKSHVIIYNSRTLQHTHTARTHLSFLQGWKGAVRQGGMKNTLL